jgi:hypothetical protein
VPIIPPLIEGVFLRSVTVELSPPCCAWQFVDALKSRLVPAHLRPPLGAINWIPPTGDTEVDKRMRGQIEQALALVRDMLDTLRVKVAEQGAEAMVRF